MDVNMYKVKMQSAVDHLVEELKKVRTGRAHPSIIEGVTVEVYGQTMSLNQVANITAPEPQLLQVTPFDPTNLQAISTAIRNDQAMGLNPSDDGRVVRVPMPPLTEELRRQIVKSLGDTVEEAKISLRNIRHDALKEAKRAKDAKEMSDDDVKRFDTQITEAINDFNSKIDSAQKAKEQEIMTV
ncbi:ribosome recycling factor [Candidatus Saccharibacteria bacterium]|jgi:ribosome recycling factor|nr:ribosome recycling factor [Candidatus Saccharibacteria bacterium]MCA9312997.1 ribosome recycling factor [Candidatus Saccharibacteria bacterium]MDQ5970134.1 ribosome recycling factor [Patescibacteria group bacterium]